jgi:hypothetical protein
MKLIVEDEIKASQGMKKIHETMLTFFGKTVELVNYWGPVQMGVFYLEYTYMPSQYKIVVECERGFITILVTNQVGNHFSPGILYPEARYYHFEDVDRDIYQLVNLTYRAIDRKEIQFYTHKEMQKRIKK